MIEYIAPIETLYRGYRFRSRLEARWASHIEALVAGRVSNVVALESASGQVGR
jgi:hypothetical protein